VAWTDEQRAKASAAARKLWKTRVEANPNANGLAKARNRRDLSQRQLALLAGVSTTTISVIENAGAVSRYTVDRIVKALAGRDGDLVATYVEAFA
jgi:transcriptional regulator with XRE-family HTH domain